jgi:K+-sensing histidine kinase KdpD
MLFHERLRKKQISFIYECTGKYYVKSELQLMINSVVGNFVSNAVKFTPRNGTVRMDAEREGDRVRIMIIDGGAGFPEALLDKVERGERYCSAEGTEGEQGSSYGLMIASLCLKKMGGSLEVCNRPEGGAIVSALLPVAEE